MSVQLIAALTSIDPTTNFAHMMDFPPVTERVARVLLGYNSEDWDLRAMDLDRFSGNLPLSISLLSSRSLTEMLWRFEYSTRGKMPYKTREEVEKFTSWSKAATVVSLVAFAVFYPLAPLSSKTRNFTGFCLAFVLTILGMVNIELEVTRQKYIAFADQLNRQNRHWRALVRELTSFYNYASAYAQQPLSRMEQIRVNTLRVITETDLIREKSEAAQAACEFVQQLQEYYTGTRASPCNES